MILRKHVIHFLAAGALMVVGGVYITVPSSAATNPPKIEEFVANPTSVATPGGVSTLSGSVRHVSSCTVNSDPPLLGGSGPKDCYNFEQSVVFPQNSSDSNEVYVIELVAYYSGRSTRASVTVTVTPGAGGFPLAGVRSTETDNAGTRCALLTAGGVDCWGLANDGVLGNGVTYSYNTGISVPVQVVGVGGTGLLSGAESLVDSSWGLNAEGASGTFCALLDSSGVDCWGFGGNGELGNGTFTSGLNDGSDTPVPVSGVGGSGSLSGVESLVGDANGTFCGVLTSGGVDCWGYGVNGELGDGMFYSSENPPRGSVTPVQVVGVGGSGVLSGVVGLAQDAGDSFCVLLTSSAVDCWGDGDAGQLGNAEVNTNSATPVQVQGVGGSSVLTGASSLVSDGNESYCAVLESSQVDCWGSDVNGQLGNDSLQNSGTPVEVLGVAGNGLLSGVQSIAAGGTTYDKEFCAILTSSGVDCWGYAHDGALGNGKLYQRVLGSSSIPVEVEAVGGIGTLTGVASLLSNDFDSMCAVLTSGGVDCWGKGVYGQLGDGERAGPRPTPVQVVGVAGIGTLNGVASLDGDASGSYCATTTAGNVECWGDNEGGELGNGTAFPVYHIQGPKPLEVIAPGET